MRRDRGDFFFEKVREIMKPYRLDKDKRKLRYNLLCMVAATMVPTSGSKRLGSTLEIGFVCPDNGSFEFGRSQTWTKSKAT